MQVLLTSKLESNFDFKKRTALVSKIEKETEDLVLGRSWLNKDTICGWKKMTWMPQSYKKEPWEEEDQ